jgi:tetratricopeptide (TPR) repeat protein
LYTQNARFADAKVLFEAMLQFYPEDEHLLRSLAYCYLHLGDYEHTLDALERCTHPGMPGGPYEAFCLLLRSKALWRLGKAQEARKCFLAFIEKSTPIASPSLYLTQP